MGVVNDVFDQVTVLALEEWGMMMVEPTEVSSTVFSDGEDLYLGSTEFHGVMHGSIKVLCGHPFMNCLCRNLLGLSEDEEISEEQSQDALKELMNVFCGNFLTQTYGDDTVFDLVYPEVVHPSEEEKNRFWASRLIHCFLADDEPIAIALGSKKDRS